MWFFCGVARNRTINRGKKLLDISIEYTGSRIFFSNLLSYNFPILGYTRPCNVNSIELSYFQSIVGKYFFNNTVQDELFGNIHQATLIEFLNLNTNP